MKNLPRLHEIWVYFRLVSTEQLIVIPAEWQGHGVWAQNMGNEIMGQWGTILPGDGTGLVRLRWAHRFTLLKNISKGKTSRDPPFNINCFSKWISLLLILLLPLCVLFISRISQGRFCHKQAKTENNQFSRSLFFLHPRLPPWYVSIKCVGALSSHRARLVRNLTEAPQRH